MSPKRIRKRKKILFWLLLILMNALLVGTWVFLVETGRVNDTAAGDAGAAPSIKTEMPSPIGTGEQAAQTPASGMPSHPGPTSEPEQSQVITESPAPTEEGSRVQQIATGMTLHEKVCQLFVTYPVDLLGRDRPAQAKAVTEAGEDLRKGLEQWPVGGILWDKSNMKNAEQLKKLLSDTQRMSKYPLIQTCDEEGGRVNRLMSTVGTTVIGPMMSYAEEGTGTAFKNAETIAVDLCAFGFNVDLAPVADVWSNPENTVIGDRAYSDDYEEAALLVAAAVEGFHEGGVAATLKHFPGHGDTSADSHYGSVYVDKTLNELREEELRPFAAGIEAGADAVMIGHLIVADIDDAPAPFSYRIVTQLLREEMGFGGVVMTDSLRMKALTDYYTSGEIAVRAIKAGVDVLLCPDNLAEAVEAICGAIEKGEISEERIDESVTRILELKLRYGIIQ